MTAGTRAARYLLATLGVTATMALAAAAIGLRHDVAFGNVSQGLVAAGAGIGVGITSLAVWLGRRWGIYAATGLSGAALLLVTPIVIHAVTFTANGPGVIAPSTLAISILLVGVPAAACMAGAWLCIDPPSPELAPVASWRAVAVGGIAWLLVAGVMGPLLQASARGGLRLEAALAIAAILASPSAVLVAIGTEEARVRERRAWAITLFVLATGIVAGLLVAALPVLGAIYGPVTPGDCTAPPGSGCL